MLQPYYVCVHILSWQVQGIQTLCDLLFLGIVHIFDSWDLCHFLMIFCLKAWFCSTTIRPSVLWFQSYTFQPSTAFFFTHISVLESLRIFSMHFFSCFHLSLSCCCASCAFFLYFLTYIALGSPSVLSVSGTCSSFWYFTACFTTKYFLFCFSWEVAVFRSGSSLQVR